MKELKEAVYGGLFPVVMLFLIALAVMQTVLPDQDQSRAENRKLQQMSAPAVGTVLSGQWMREMETYVSDQMPGRDQWMNLQAVWDATQMKNERNGILLGKDGWLFEKSANLDLRTVRANVAAMDALGEWSEAPVSLMLVPMSSALYPEYLPSFYRGDDQFAIIQSLYDSAQNLQTIPVAMRLMASRIWVPATGMIPLYYRTDHHWTYDGARLGYDAWCVAKGIPIPTEKSDITAVSGFYGTYYSRAPSPFIQPETFIYGDTAGLRLVEGTHTFTDVHDERSLSLPAERDKYAALLHGNRGHVTLYNDQGPEGTLLVIKDSYANAILPWLANHYNRIEIIDPRYFGGDLAGRIEELEADEILCIYGLTTLLTDRSLLLFSGGWGG